MSGRATIDQDGTPADRWKDVPAAAQAAGHVDGHRLAAELSGLRRVAAAVVARTDPTEALNLAAAEVAALMGAEQGFVFRVVEGERVMVAGASGIEGTPVGAVHALLPTGVVPEVVRSRASARVEGRLRPLGRENSDRYWIAPLYRGGIGAPVFVGDVLWGALVAATTHDDPFPPGAEGRLGYFAEIAGIAIGNAEANERLARLAMSDSLTGLANNRAFHESLEAEVERARRHGRPLALAVIDIDHFKAVNDTHGHLVGDQALIEVAARLVTVARRGDTVARVGGEEFAWILPETDREGARRVAERARRAMSVRPVPVVGRLTVSIGVAELAQAGGRHELYRLADEALYRAKRSGRDRAVGYDAQLVVDATPPAGERRPTGGDVARALARAIGARDPWRRVHGERVAALAERLAQAAGWPSDLAARLAEAALVHELGAIGSPGGAALASEILADVMSPDQVAWVRGHAERWDGGGGPDGLAGAAIPEGARMIAVADRWDALTLPPPPRLGLPTAGALDAMRALAGSALCPEAVAHLTGLVGPDVG